MNSSVAEAKVDTTYLEDGALVERVCESHGPYQATFHRYSGHAHFTLCKRCDEERIEARRVKEEDDARIARENRIADLKRASAIPSRFRSKTLADYRATTSNQKRALQLATRLAQQIIDQENSGESLLFVGRPGTGKTHLATSIALQLVENLRSARYSTASDIARRVRDSYARGSEETESDVLDDLSTVRLLVIDELGVGAATDHAQRVLFEVIDARYRDERPMVLISNLTTSELAASMGERLIDRMNEIAVTVPFDWQSHRGVAKT